MPPKPRKHLETLIADPEGGTDDDAERGEVFGSTGGGDEREVTESDYIRADGSLSPDAPFFTVRVSKRVRANHTASFTWQTAVTYNGERYSDWAPLPPIERVRADCGSGDYRYEVFHRNVRPEKSKYPELVCPQMFYIPHASESSRESVAPPPAPTPAPAPAASNGSGGSVDVGSLVKTIADSFRPTSNGHHQQQPAASAGMTAEQLSTLSRASEDAKKALGELDNLREARVKAAENAVPAAEARAAKDAELSRRLDLIEARIKKLEDRDPVSDIKKLKEQAQALGYEQSGTLGVAKEGVAALREIIQYQSAQGAGLPSSPGQQQLPQNTQQPQPTPTPQPNTQLPMARHWRTQDNGEWALLGDLVHWVGTELLKPRDLTPDEITYHAWELLGGSETDSRWLAQCKAEDVRKLFAYVFGESHALMSHWSAMVGSVETVLKQYPIHFANKYAEARREWPAWLEEALRARNALPKPIDPRTLPPKPKGADVVPPATIEQQPATATGNSTATTT